MLTFEIGALLPIIFGNFCKLDFFLEHKTHGKDKNTKL